jgi:transcriptional regulator with XRE-family HTH domain
MNDNSIDRKKLQSLGKRIKKVRGERSLSQEELAELAGVHRTYVGMIERGEKNVTVLSAQKISAALGISISELFKGYEDG